MRAPVQYAVLGLAGSLAGCSAGDPSGPQASQIAVVIVDEVAYAGIGTLDPGARPVGEAYAEVLRFVDCSAGFWISETIHVSDWCPLENGDSNFLPAGTVLYRIQGVEPAEALAVYREYTVAPPIDPEWIELAPLAGRDACLDEGEGSLCSPG